MDPYVPPQNMTLVLRSEPQVAQWHKLSLEMNCKLLQFWPDNVKDF